MKFNYRQVAPGILRPIIPVNIKYKKLSVPYAVLVDSGADFCIFHSDVADILGIPFQKGEQQQLVGVTGNPVPMFIYPITLEIGGWDYKIKAGFTKFVSKYGYGVVGQKGFFEHFTVKFDYQKTKINIVPKNK
ncbi:hypothetical protein CL633_02510 [bacterium]|nr:hypothetical protein [bacterium]|tara:strand:+ start:2075 stop:2473 length:399 start_codon:yes stop_codon:yes gene_type:complete